MPRRARLPDFTRRNSIHQLLRKFRCLPQFDETCQEDTGIEKGLSHQGHLSRSSLMRNEISMGARCSGGTVGRATSLLFLRTILGRGTARTSRIDKSRTSTSNSIPALRPIRERIGAGITTRPALSIVVFMVLIYHMLYQYPRRRRYTKATQELAAYYRLISLEISGPFSGSDPDPRCRERGRRLPRRRVAWIDGGWL